MHRVVCTCLCELCISEGFTCVVFLYLCKLIVSVFLDAMYLFKKINAETFNFAVDFIKNLGPHL